MTTKVRITNIVEEGGAHSNGDIIVNGLAGGRRVLFPGDSVEEWLEHGETPTPLVISERWPSKKAA